jgi:hypothetical protein
LTNTQISGHLNSHPTDCRQHVSTSLVEFAGMNQAAEKGPPRTAPSLFECVGEGRSGFLHNRGEGQNGPLHSIVEKTYATLFCGIGCS